MFVPFSSVFDTFGAFRRCFFDLVLRFACVLWCVVCVLRLKIKRICDDRIKLDKIYGFSFFVRLRVYFVACLVLVPFGPAVRPSWAGGTGTIF